MRKVLSPSFAGILTHLPALMRLSDSGFSNPALLAFAGTRTIRGRPCQVACRPSEMPKSVGESMCRSSDCLAPVLAAPKPAKVAPTLSRRLQVSKDRRREGLHVRRDVDRRRGSTDAAFT